MKKIVVEEIVPVEEFERGRPGRRGEIIRLKDLRRVSLGPLVSLLFENRETVLWQIQEMCRVERIGDPAKIAEEVEVYNALIPPDGSLSATLLIEITEQKEIKPALDRLLGIDEPGVLTLHIGEKTTRENTTGEKPNGKEFDVPGDFEPGHSSEEKLSAVHYVHFHLSAAARRAFLDPAAPARLVIAHPNYRAEAPLEGEIRKSLMDDLREGRKEDRAASFQNELDRLIEFQRRKVIAEGERLNPRLTPDDLLMASDFPELAADPRFNYEDGILTGLLEARTLVRRIMQEG